MAGMLQPGTQLRAQPGGPVEVGELIGSGGQGEVYRVRVDGTEKALKWYFREMATAEQRQIIETLVHFGNSDARFLWPEALVDDPQHDHALGYLMQLRPAEFASLPALFRRTVRTTTSALVTACIHLAEGYRALHSRGIAYRDISWGNVFFAPDDGRVLICDNDNAIFEGQDSGIAGTLEFMAPELVRGVAHPRTQTDLHSLAVLLFMVLVNHHPLKGRKELEIPCLDADAQKRLYGTDPLFVFDPTDHRNRAEPGEHDHVVAAWKTLPGTIQDLFITAFTDGLHNPEARVRESQWRDALSRTRDAIVHCAGCGGQNIHDDNRRRQAGEIGRAHV